MSVSDHTREFLSKLEELLPSLEIDLTSSTLAQYRRTTFPTDITEVLAVISPTQAKDIEIILREAAKNRVVLYPLSGGRNWGYGGKVPTSVEAVILDLSQLNKVIEEDWEAGVVTLEPGVTYGQLQAKIAASGKSWHFNGPGIGPDASVIGHILERGLAQGPTLERWSSVRGMNISMPNGMVYRTHSYATTSAHRGVPAGPDITPLFFQSNLGIVTQMVIALDPLPAHWQHLHCSWLESDAPLEDVTEVFRGLVKSGFLSSCVSVHNAEKILSVMGPSGSSTLLDPAIKKQKLDEIEGGDWFIETAICAPTEGLLTAYRTAVAAQLDELPLQIHWAEPNKAGPMYHQETQGSLTHAYWRAPQPVPANPHPDRDDCGLIWFCPVVPWRTQDIASLPHVIEEELSREGFDPMITLQFPNFRYGYLVVSILFNHQDQEEAFRALQVYKNLSSRMINSGFYPYRLNLIDHHDGLNWELDHSRDEFLTKLKYNADPERILAPGRYDYYYLV